jgi:polar amino acid transport system substrate-binding protein
MLQALAAAATEAPASTTLRLHVQQRPPYSSLGPSGQADGLLVAPVSEALQRAGLRAEWRLTPSQRQLALIQDGQGMDCGVGWYRNPERELRGRFSQAIYRDRPYTALLRGERMADRPRSLHDLLSDRSMTLLVKTGYSYGADIDQAIVTARPALQQTTAEPALMARMVAAGRAGWMLMAHEEAEWLLRTEFANGPLRIQLLAGQGPGPTRHLYCNFAVPPALLDRLDKALPALPRP